MKPTPKTGFVIESDPPVDLGKWWLIRAHKTISAWDTVPRTLTVPSVLGATARACVDEFECVLVVEINDEYDEDEWSLSGTGGLGQIIFWSPGACG